MKSLALLFLVVGIVFMTMGYMERRIQEKEENKVIEYRFVPRSLIEEQTYGLNLKKNFSDMFELDDVRMSSSLV